jgi:2-methylcitrate dehydratase PrpD
MAARGSDPYARGFHPTGVYGALGAAASAAIVLGATRETLAQALGIAGSMGAGSMAYLQNGAWTKKLHAGWAAMSGLVAAILAVTGFKGPEAILDAPYDMLRSHSDQVALEKLHEELAQRAEIERMSFKPWACCRAVHPAISAVLTATRGRPFGPSDVTAVDLVIPEEDLLLVAEPEEAKRLPRSTVDAQFSLYWATAVALARGQVGLDDFEQDALDDAALRELSTRVTYRTDAELTARRPLEFPCRVRITLRDGRVLAAAVDAPIGDFVNPISDDDLAAKAATLLSWAYGPVAARDAASMLAELGDADDALLAFARMTTALAGAAPFGTAAAGRP